jgi:radical SAM superfamily enzyme YgiQ (UPF0313 family)
MIPTIKEKYSRIESPFGLLAIASPLIRNGYEVILIDPRLDNKYLKKINKYLSENVAFVGMTTFMGFNILNAVKLSSHIKRVSPSTPIVWGGPLATSSPELCFQDTAVDYIVMGMGEETVVKVAERLSNKKDATELPNVSSHINNRIIIKDKFFFQGDLDAIDYPELTLWKDGIQKVGSVPILTSRGCPRNCSFCYNSTFVGRKKWYSRTAKNVQNEMDYWSNIFGINTFHFIDDNFLVNTKRAHHILKNSIEKNYKITQILGHLNDYKAEIVELISGHIEHVGFSIESASPRIQRLLNKIIDLQKALSMFKYFSEKGIKTINTNFMFGFPTETDEDILANIKMACEIRSINSKIRMVPYVYTPQPKDDLITSFKEYYDKINFTIDILSTIDFAPNRSNYLAHEIRPWMTRDDIKFYLDLVLAWFYHFDYVVREDQGIDIESIYKSNKRLANLFRDVPMP